MPHSSNYDIVIRVGCDFLATFQAVDDNGDGVDLTGATIEAEVRRTEGGPLLATMSCTLTTAASGIFTCSLTAVQTAALPLGAAVWDVLITDAGGTRLPWDDDAQVGSVLIRKGVTE